MKNQKTIADKVTFSGIGVHTGSKTTMTFLPAPVNTGIQFIRVDLPNHPVINAGIESVVETERGTILGTNEAKVHTVEHVMAALWAFGISNIKIELDAEEPPVGDGSSLQFVNLIESVGVVEQDGTISYFKVIEPITISEKDTFLTLVPYDGFKVSYTLSYDHHLVNTQYVSADINKETFVKDFAPARTFCFYREVESLMDKGLIQGGSLDNAVVVGDEAILSKEGLRFNNEFARHKVLDLIGDLYLLGIRIEGHIVAVKSGHTLNVKLAKMLRDKSLGVKYIKKDTEKSKTLNIEQIKKLLPHRYPFLLVDRIIELRENGAVGIKNITANEDYFNGHFPIQALMPGVLQLEAMAQVAGISYLHNNDIKNKMAILAGVENAKFRRPVTPGDQLVMEVEFGKFRRSIGRASGVSKVNGEIVSEAEFLFALIEVQND